MNPAPRRRRLALATLLAMAAAPSAPAPSRAQIGDPLRAQPRASAASPIEVKIGGSAAEKADCAILVPALGPIQRLRVAAGAPGSGGEVTMHRILALKPDWNSHVELRNEPASTAIRSLKHGNPHAVFVLDGIESPWLESVLAQKDSRGRPISAFAEMRPGRQVTGQGGPKEAARRPLSARVTLASGLFRDTRVVSTPAVPIVSEAFARTPEGERAIRVLGEAVGRAVPTVRSATRTPTDWDPQSNAF